MPVDPPSLAALLDIGPDEVLGVLLEHVVDLVEQVVGVLGQLFATFLTGRTVTAGVSSSSPPPVRLVCSCAIAADLLV